MKVAQMATGPGVICPSAMASANALESSQPCSLTTMCSMAGIIARPPPNVMTPIGTNTRTRAASAVRLPVTTMGRATSGSDAVQPFALGRSIPAMAGTARRRGLRRSGRGTPT